MQAACCKQLAQNTEFCNLLFNCSLRDDLCCKDSGGAESSTRSMNLQKFSSLLSYLNDEEKKRIKNHERNTRVKIQANLVKSRHSINAA